jgi:membrane fusion protein, multidrug efflux system
MIPKINNSILLLLFILSACGKKAGEKEEKSVADIQAIPVVAEQVKEIPFGSEISVSGNVEGNKTVKLGFMVAGRIRNIISQEGQQVSKGQLIASLDPSNYTIAKQMANVQVSQAQDEYNRLKIMFERNSISESDFKKAGFALEQAKTQQKLQAQNLGYTKLNAPISGVIIKALAEAGEITSVGNPVIVISDISTVNVNAYIPENQLNAIKLGQPATVQIAALEGTYIGKVVEVGSDADPTSRAFTVKIRISNSERAIRPGMIAKVEMQGNRVKQAIAVPGESIVREADGQAFVYVVDLKQQKAFKRPVSIGQLVDNKIEITSGVAARETIVTGGQHKLSDGAAISLSN